MRKDFKWLIDYSLILSNLFNLFESPVYVSHWDTGIAKKDKFSALIVLNLENRH
jgi:hypothetical protein